MQSDGKILVGGKSYDGSNERFGLARYNANGSLDTTFGGDGKVTTDVGSGNDYIHSITVQSDGKILAAGYSFSVSDGYDFSMTRYNANGSLDTSFSGDGKVFTDFGFGAHKGYSVTVQDDGKILVAGISNADFALARYNVNGSLDTSFGVDGKVTTAIGSGDDYGYDVTVQSDGKILVAGYSDNGSYDLALTRYNADGSLDTTFDLVNTLDGTPTFTEGGGAGR